MADPQPDPKIVQHVKSIIRRDLKLGETTPIADDMPFYGNDVDLDSLDLLLLLTSIEREFGLKIPSEEAGRSVFQNVTTLASYIQANAGNAASSATVNAAAQMTDPLEHLPHREPFRFVSKVTAIRAGESAEGVWSLAGTEAFFAGHFPGRPLVPGVLITEALAQLSGLVVGTKGQAGKLVHVDVRFEQAVAPPAEIELRSKLARAMAPLYQFEVSASANGAVVARGSLALQLA